VSGSWGNTSWHQGSDAEVWQLLNGELERVQKADAFQILYLERDCNDQAVRGAFLQATKIFHPNRFALRDKNVARFASEVFMVIKTAYGSLLTKEGREKAVSIIDNAASASRAIRVPTTQTQIQRLDDGTPVPAVQRVTTSRVKRIDPGTGPPQPTPVPVATRVPTPPPQSSPIVARVPTPPARPALELPARGKGKPKERRKRPSTIDRISRLGAGLGATTPGTSPPSARMTVAELKAMALKERHEADKAKAELEKQSKAKAAQEEVNIQRGSSRPRSGGASPAARAAAARLAKMMGKKAAAPEPAPEPTPEPTPEPAAQPPTTSTTPAADTQEDPIERIQAREEARVEEYREAIALIRHGKLQEASESFRKLAIEVPSDRKYRVYMHYTWGRIHHSRGTYEDARVEYNRAIKLEPSFTPAHESIEALPPDPNKKDGVFKKLFRK